MIGIIYFSIMAEGNKPPIFQVLHLPVCNAAVLEAVSRLPHLASLTVDIAFKFDVNSLRQLAHGESQARLQTIHLGVQGCCICPYSLARFLTMMPCLTSLGFMEHIRWLHGVNSYQNHVEYEIIYFTLTRYSRMKCSKMVSRVIQGKLVLRITTGFAPCCTRV